MDKVTVTRKLDGSEAQVKMTTVDDKGQSRERELSMATKLYDGGKTEKRVYRFVAPADVQGTSILVFDYEAKPDDVWIYLPALRKTRRIVSSQRAQSFMGSEFSYGDLNIPALDDFDYKLAKEEAVKRRALLGHRSDAEEQGRRRRRRLLEEDLLGQQGQDRRRPGALLRQGRQAAEGAGRREHQAPGPEEQALPPGAHGDDQQAERAKVHLRVHEDRVRARTPRTTTSRPRTWNGSARGFRPLLLAAAAKADTSGPLRSVRGRSTSS